MSIRSKSHINTVVNRDEFECWIHDYNFAQGGLKGQKSDLTLKCRRYLFNTGRSKNVKTPRSSSTHEVKPKNYSLQQVLNI